MKLCGTALPSLLLAACASGPGRETPPPPVLQAIGSDQPAESVVAAPGLDLLPPPLASGLHRRLREEAPMRAQPLSRAQVLRLVPAGTPVRVLGQLDNANGRWASVQVGDTVGWVPAQQLEDLP